ncbi:hypothetical protein E3983_11010 [Legionella israelensis]|uniref:Low-complexity protein n=1 Tax=Legionella israelensis TaxID=454 RepID=A0AAX1EJ65_9GAMM|nr:hypothetical protein [Legionella israelensis]QBR84834.1 hypothetical protein E3983_11010 [Legionella israelensis]
MKSKSTLLALGASLSLGLANMANADTGNAFQAEKLQTGYSNTDGSFKIAKSESDTDNNKNDKNDKNDKNGNGKCGSGKCGSNGGKCGAGKCGAGKCGSKS